MKGQWFIITAVVLTGIFFVISGFYATYSKTKDTDIIGSDTAYYFKNVKTAIDKLRGLQYDDRHLNEFIYFSRKNLEERGINFKLDGDVIYMYAEDTVIEYKLPQ